MARLSPLSLLVLTLTFATSALANVTLQDWATDGLTGSDGKKSVMLKPSAFKLIKSKGKGTKVRGKDVKQGLIVLTMKASGGSSAIVNRPVADLTTRAGVRKLLATCSILTLDLQGLKVNLLGLNIDLSPVLLDIFAAPGDNALLGNLLCAVAGLLDAPTVDLNAIVGLLNQILAIL